MAIVVVVVISNERSFKSGALSNIEPWPIGRSRAVGRSVPAGSYLGGIVSFSNSISHCSGKSGAGMCPNPPSFICWQVI